MGWFEENLIVNGDFGTLDGEGRLVSWEAVGARGEQESLGSSTPGYSGRLRREERGEGFWRQEVPGDLEPGGRYVVSGWVRGRPGAVAFLGIEVAERGQREPRRERIFRGLADSEWQPVSFEFTAPPSGRVMVVAGGDFEGSLSWRDITLGRAEELPERLARIWEERLQRYPRVYTGLVVDARGLGIARSMSPFIVDSDGHVLYTGADASHDVVIRKGIVSYMKDLPEALSHSRLAAHELYPYRLPLVVQAVGKVQDGFDRGVIVRAHDAAVIRKHLMRYDFLARYAVVFLID